MLETAKCAHCGKSFNHKMQYCPFCGGANVDENSNETLLCPRCRGQLEIHNYHDISLEVCPECSGIWVDHQHFKQLTSKRAVYADEHIPNQYLKEPLPNESGYLPCVSCGKLMLRTNFFDSNVLIDFCRHHGIWLDKEELEQIRCFIANGGLEEYQEKEMAGVKGEIQSLADKLRGVEFMQEILHYRDLKYRIFKGF